MCGWMGKWLIESNFTPDGLPREGANVISWGPPENRQREKYLEKYGAKTDDDRNFLRSLSTSKDRPREMKPSTQTKASIGVSKKAPSSMQGKSPDRRGTLLAEGNLGRKTLLG